MSASLKIAFDSAFAALKRQNVVSFDIWVSFGTKTGTLPRRIREFESAARLFGIWDSKVVKPRSCVIDNFGFSQNSTSFECFSTSKIQEFAHSYATNSMQTLRKLVQIFHKSIQVQPPPFVTSNFKAFRSLSFWLRNRELNFPLSFIQKLRLPSPALAPLPSPTPSSIH